MMEYWNNGRAPFGQNLASLCSAIGKLEYAGWVLGIPYHQQFVEFPLHLIDLKGNRT
jgi:hypothetical protein